MSGLKIWLALLPLIGLWAAPDTARASAVLDPHQLVGCYISMGYWDLPYANEQFASLSASGVNFVIDYALFWPDNQAEQEMFDAYLNMAGRHNISVAYCLFNALKGATPRSSAAQVEYTLHLVEVLSQKQAISAWYVHDEILPMLAGVDGTELYSLSLEQMIELYEDISRIDPQRPQISVWNQLPDNAEMNRRFAREHFPHGYPDYIADNAAFEVAMQRLLRDTCDWVMVDSYPVGASWLEDGQSLPAISREIELLVSRAVELKSREQPLIFVYQVFDWHMYGKGAAVAGFPSMEQLRTMLYAAFAAGADNVLAYSWFDLVRSVDGVHPADQARCMADLQVILGELAARN